MNCRNCGAAMELFERRRYYFCRYCGSFHFLDNPESDGIRVLETPAQAPACPRCSTKLATAQLDDAHPVHCCSRCRGVLLPRSTFAHVVYMRRTWATSQPVPPLPLDRRELERAINCPRCSKRMDVHPYYGPGNVIIDSCTTCDLVWLDIGELKQIADAPGGDRGVRKPPIPRSPSPPSPTEASVSGAGTDVLGLLFDLLT